MSRICYAKILSNYLESEELSKEIDPDVELLQSNIFLNQYQIQFLL